MHWVFILAAPIVVLSNNALADITGPVGVIDGDTIEVQGQFIGYESFCRETGRLAQACREFPPAPWYKERGHERVRLPGDGALACRAKALANGVTPLPSIMSMLEDLANKLKVAVPTPVAQ